MDRRIREECLTHSPEETMALGKGWGERLSKNTVLCFHGDLGAGKTTLIKGIVQGATGLSLDEVQSPTFVYLIPYEGKTVVYHFDLYRLQSAEEFFHMGFDDYFSCGGICCIEWAERIAPYLPRCARHIHCTAPGENTRRISWKGES